MKTKEVILGIKSQKDFFSEIKNSWDCLASGNPIESKEAIYFETVEAMRKNLTPLRIEILKMIKKNTPSSIYELAKMMDQDVTNLYKQLKALEEIGLVKFEQESKSRKKIIPLVHYDEIDIKIPLTQYFEEG